VALQVAILKVLSSHPDGRATLAALNADLAILASSGAEWTQRLKRLSALVPDLDIFGQGLVQRDESGWQLTRAGSELLRRIETPVPGALPQGDRAPLCAARAIDLAGRGRDIPHSQQACPAGATVSDAGAGMIGFCSRVPDPALTSIDRSLAS